MNDSQFAAPSPSGSRFRIQVAATDAAGMVWGHSDPVELYRWIAQRNDLLQTIAAAFPRDRHSRRQPLAS